MYKRTLGVLMLTAIFTFTFTQAYSQTDKESESLHTRREADGIRHAVWELDSGTDPIAKKLKECPASGTIGIENCLAEAQASYQKILDNLPLPGDKNSCGGTICGILSGYHQIAKIREQIAERSYNLGGGQE